MKPSDAYLGAAPDVPLAFTPSGSCLVTIKGAFVSLPLTHVSLGSFRRQYKPQPGPGIVQLRWIFRADCISWT